MDELDLLKKDWKKQEASFPKLSYNEIYKIIHKKSSSIVKWILIICVAEFILWNLANIFIPEDYYQIYEKFHLKTFMYAIYIVHYSIVFAFIYIFYKNYKSICVIDSTKLLMQKIIRTRKTVNYYVYYNIIGIIVISAIFNFFMFSQPDILMEVYNPKNIKIESDKFFTVILIVQLVVLALMCGILWLYYRIIYGILLRKLSKNYKELERLEN